MPTDHVEDAEPASSEHGQLADATLYVLSQERESALLEEQYECTLAWTNKAGHAVAVVQAYVYQEGCFWLASTISRARVKALLRDPRCSVVVSGTGTSIGKSKALSYKGVAEIIDDRAVLVRVLNAIMMKYDPEDPGRREAHFKAVDHPGRVIIKITPTVRTNAFDGDMVKR